MASLSIKAKFAALAGVMLLTVSIIITTFLTEQQESTIRDEFQRRAIALTGTLAYNCQLPLVTENTTTLTQLSSGLQKTEGVFYIEFANADQMDLLKLGDVSRDSLDVRKVVGSRELANGTVSAWLRLADGREILDIHAPVTLGDRASGNGEDILATKQRGSAHEILGFVRVGLSTFKAQERIAKMRSLAYLLGVLIAFVGSVVAALVIHLMMRSLSHLMEGNRRLAKGDFSVRLKVRSQDEFGRLAKSFNQMAQEVEKSRELAHRYLDNLRTNADKLEEANRALKLNNAEISKVSQLKSEFLAVMSHELRTPLNGIIGFSEVLLKQQHGKLNLKQRRFIENSLKSGKHLLALINDILDLSKIEAGKMEVTARTFHLQDAFEEVQSLTSGLASDKNIDLTVEEVPSVELNTDETVLKQVLINLLSNAIKFTPESGAVKVRARQMSGKELRGESISHALPKKRRDDIPDAALIFFEVEDNGVGIAPEDYERIFVAFQQLDESYSRRQEGTGLGLALTRKLIDLLRGDIWFTSRQNEGTHFFFYVTQSLDEDTEEIEKTEHQSIEKPEPVTETESRRERKRVEGILWPWGDPRKRKKKKPDSDTEIVAVVDEEPS